MDLHDTVIISGIITMFLVFMVSLAGAAWWSNRH
jgi:hypothetical protein